MQPSDTNPYAPPKIDLGGPLAQPQGTPYRNPVQIAEALRQLHEYVADPRNMEADRAVAGARVRPVAWVLTGIGSVGTATMAALTFTPQEDVLFFAGLGVMVILVVLGLLLIFVDLSLVARAKPASPEKTLKSFFKGASMGRFGYAWSFLSPTARNQTVSSPQLAPIPTVPGVFPLRGEADIKAYFQSFARTGGSVVRVLAAKKVELESIEGDVARVRAELRFQSWPLWVSIATGVGFFIFRPLLVVGAIAFFITRKRRNVNISKTLLRAPNGVWYLFDGDALEGTNVS